MSTESKPTRRTPLTASNLSLFPHVQLSRNIGDGTISAIPRWGLDGLDCPLHPGEFMSVEQGPSPWAPISADQLKPYEIDRAITAIREEVDRVTFLTNTWKEQRLAALTPVGSEVGKRVADIETSLFNAAAYRSTACYEAFPLISQLQAVHQDLGDSQSDDGATSQARLKDRLKSIMRLDADSFGGWWFDYGTGLADDESRAIPKASKTMSVPEVIQHLITRREEVNHHLLSQRWAESGQVVDPHLLFDMTLNEKPEHRHHNEHPSGSNKYVVPEVTVHCLLDGVCGRWPSSRSRKSDLSTQAGVGGGEEPGRLSSPKSLENLNEEMDVTGRTTQSYTTVGDGRDAEEPPAHAGVEPESEDRASRELDARMYVTDPTTQLSTTVDGDSHAEQSHANAGDYPKPELDSYKYFSSHSAGSEDEKIKSFIERTRRKEPVKVPDEKSNWPDTIGSLDPHYGEHLRAFLGRHRPEGTAYSIT